MAKLIVLQARPLPIAPPQILQVTLVKQQGSLEVALPWPLMNHHQSNGTAAVRSQDKTKRVHNPDTPGPNDHKQGKTVVTMVTMVAPAAEQQHQPCNPGAVNRAILRVAKSTPFLLVQTGLPSAIKQLGKIQSAEVIYLLPLSHLAR